MDDPEADAGPTTGPGLRRRSLLAALAAAGTASLAGCPAPDDDPTTPSGGGESTSTSTADSETASRLAERFAPTFAFDAAERWLPTDPRPYTSERDGETVVDGFDAVDGYTRRYREAGDPPEPTVFYHVVEYDDSPLSVVQFWYYSAFDQFTTNFHWHDWEVLHVFVDTETEEPRLFVASSHSGRVPNNEHLDPDPDQVPRVLSELGSHSSALSLNDRPNSFQRLPLDDLPADITNRALDAVEQLAELPAAYGLPRDEGLRLPYVVPELDGTPIHEHEDLPSVDRDALVSDALTVRSFDALSAPPTDLPVRETGLVFAPEGSTDTADADVAYDLVPSRELEDIDEFTGPQLSFEFAVPAFAEDAVAGHITTAGTPWDQPRYDDPAADITEPAHRAALSDRYDAIDPPGPLNDLVATVSETVQSSKAPDDEGVETADSPVETVVLLRSDPVAAPTFRGVAMLRGVAEGDHRLTVNGPGFAPHAEPVTVGDGSEAAGTTTATTTAGTDAGGPTAVTLAGVGGEIPLVPAEEATKIEVDADGVDDELEAFAVDDDFGGRLYEAPLDGPDAVYVHRGGAYTAEVRDADDAVGAFRVNPSGTDPVRIDRPRTGTASLASFVEELVAGTTDRLGAVGDETNDDADEDDTPGASGATQTLGGLLRALEAVSGAAGRAAERAEAGDRGGADRALSALADSLDRAVERFDGLRGTLPAERAAATERQLREARRRTNQAAAAEKL